ncbi:MAG: HDOD domain-containing protein [Nitrospiraceae bacterium]|nr:HDOD domain-containing protein [Nitrospiraceae bacterium]
MGTPNVAEAIEAIRALPTLPSMLTQILATAADPDASAVDLSRHIVSDQTLSAALLRLVNSAYYGMNRRIDSITRAIVLLGFFEVRNLTLAATTFTNFPANGSGFDRTQLWRHSLGAAIAAERLARASGREPEGAFVAGLLHDIGKVVLDVLYPDLFREASRLAHVNKTLVVEPERDLFSLDHATAGGMLAEHWQLPAMVVASIRHHHGGDGEEFDAPLTALAAMADFVVYEADLGESSNGRSPAFPEAAAQTLGITGEQWRSVAGHMRESHDRIDHFLGTLTGQTAE